MGYPTSPELKGWHKSTALPPAPAQLPKGAWPTIALAEDGQRKTVQRLSRYGFGIRQIFPAPAPPLLSVQ
jgi:hypothetical protein